MSSDEEDKVEDFVGGLAEAGETVESSADFTLSKEKALEKLTGVLKDSKQWVLKAVQAGVAEECESIEITTKRSSTTVRWAGLKSIAASDLESDFVNVKTSERPFLRELIIGLRALFGECEFEFSSGGKVTFSKDRQLTVGKGGSTDGVVTLVVKQEGISSDYIHRHCLFCPVSLTLNGRSLLEDALSTLCRFSGTHHEEFPQMVTSVGLKQEDSSLKVSPYPKLQDGFSKRKWDRTPVVNSALKGNPNRLFVWCAAESKEIPIKGDAKMRTRTKNQLQAEPVTVFWLRHGVVCAQDEIHENKALGVAISCDASDQRSDLSGLAIQEKPFNLDEIDEVATSAVRTSRYVLEDEFAKRMPEFSVPVAEEMGDRLLIGGVYGIFGGGAFLLLLIILSYGIESTGVNLSDYIDLDNEFLGIAYLYWVLIIPAILTAPLGFFQSTGRLLNSYIPSAFRQYLD